MTPLDKPSRSVTRLTIEPLDGTNGKDRGRKIVATLAYGDLLQLRPHGTRRVETLRLQDLWSYALRCKANKTHMEKLRERKAKIAERKAAAKSKRIIRGGLRDSS